MSYQSNPNHAPAYTAKKGIGGGSMTIPLAHQTLGFDAGNLGIFAKKNVPPHLHFISWIDGWVR